MVPTQLGTFLAKVLLVCSFQILIRWTLPRFRYDQVLKFAWKFLFPLALANLCVTVFVLWLMATSCSPLPTRICSSPPTSTAGRSPSIA